MIAALLVLAQVLGAPPATPSAATPVAPRPPQDWSRLAPLRFVAPPRPDPGVSVYVRSETQAGRCAATTRTADGWALRVDMAALVGADGRARQIIPRAIDCPTVEQFAVGLMSRTTRDNVDAAGILADIWLKTSLTFAWTN
ncbi:hypothetical protein [Sphingomonas sp.]|uniref:hypothetical protein n=1 Tax=Sphingomonas sp. TaxID=28214 RepID=UPI0035BC9056